MIVGTYECPRCGRQIRFQLEPVEIEALEEPDVELVVELIAKPHKCRAGSRPHTRRSQSAPSMPMPPPYFGGEDGYENE